jgi:hypothetical protein
MYSSNWKEFSENAMSKIRHPKPLGLVLGGVFTLLVFQFHFLRELLAAEFLLGLVFFALLVILGIVYTIGVAGQWGLDAVAVRIHSRPPLSHRRPHRF